MIDAITRNTMPIAACLLAFSSGIAFAAMAMQPRDNATQCKFIAETVQGDIYVLGVGDSCKDAFRHHGPIPADSALSYEMSKPATRGIPAR